MSPASGAAETTPQPYKAGPAERSLYFLALAGVGCLGLLICLAQLAYLIHRAPSLGIFVVCVIMAALPVPIYATIIASLDRHVQEPVGLLFAAFFWGALVATLIALLMNTGAEVIINDFVRDPDLVARLTASFSGPLVEETAKGLALLLIFVFFRAQINDVVDGIVLGALVGLGFAMMENVGYFERAFRTGGLQLAVIQFYVRVILNGFGHAMYTASTGAGLGLAAETPSPNVRLAAPIFGWFVAMFLHFSWNTFFGPIVQHFAGNADPLRALLVNMPLAASVLMLPGIITLLAITFFAWRRESKVITEFLRDEVANGVVRPEEYAVLTSDQARTHHVWSTLFTRGPTAWRLLRQLYNEEAALAFRKWHAAPGEDLPSFQRAQSEDAHREHIARIRKQLQESMQGMSMAGRT